MLNSVSRVGDAKGFVSFIFPVLAAINKNKVTLVGCRLHKFFSALSCRRVYLGSPLLFVFYLNFTSVCVKRQGGLKEVFSSGRSYMSESKSIFSLNLELVPRQGVAGIQGRKHASPELC